MIDLFNGFAEKKKPLDWKTVPIFLLIPIFTKARVSFVLISVTIPSKLFCAKRFPTINQRTISYLNFIN
tara:strand:+ start:446 stop:652 length:207 start_codon:yes stop_codon:yes gene_type:complete